MSQAARYLNKPDARSPINEQILHGRLITYFKTRSMFNVRCKLRLLHDHISPAVHADDFDQYFNRKDRELCVTRKWVERIMFHDPLGGHRAAYVFVDKVLPPVERWKRVFCFMEEKLPYVLLACLALFLAVVALLLTVNQASACSPVRPSQIPVRQPNSGIRKYVDQETGIICYWSTDLGISCLPTQPPKSSDSRQSATPPESGPR